MLGKDNSQRILTAFKISQDVCKITAKSSQTQKQVYKMYKGNEIENKSQ